MDINEYWRILMNILSMTSIGGMGDIGEGHVRARVRGGFINVGSGGMGAS